MKDLVRGGVSLLLLSMFVVFIYAQQAPTDDALALATDSQLKIENNISDISNHTLIDNSDDDKKLVKTTVSAKAKTAGSSRGAFSATAYCLKGRTALGHGVRRGIIAADPRVL